ncbi:Major Facilitator Superfamily protein [Prauserella aidingensis]|uniref:MFS transporter n=1 Tax=Prauserella aidingensis TaxID=387890 RepID=UPI0020A4262E|nr:MFS transporter [Prauserella aidingensis]MCP2253884.1 Major Facilitator Superfamily protein [Prauserella aidingensis]
MAAAHRLGLWTSCLAQLLVVLDISVVNVALPSIQADLGLGRLTASWVAMAYSLGFAGVLLVGARLADVVGTARLLAWGAAAFALAGTIGGLAGEGWTLVAARAVQGLAAAVVSPATFTLLTATHAEGPSRTRAIAVWTAVSLAGGGIGNVGGGVFTDLISWRVTLLINLPIGAGVAVAAAVLHRRRVADPCGGRMSLTGVVLATGAFTGAAYALSSAGEPAAGVAPALAGGGALVLFVLLVVQQRRTPHRLVPSALLRDRTIVLGNLATGLTATSFQVGLWYFLTYRMQDQWGYTPIQAGLAFLPITAAIMVVNLGLTPRLTTRYAPGVLVTAGTLIAAGGLIWVAVVDHGPFVIAFLVPSVVIGIGGGLVNTPLATIVTTGVGSGDTGAASGLMNTAKQFGGAIGLAAASTATAAAGTDAAAFVLMAAALAAVSTVMAGIRRVRGSSTPGAAAGTERVSGPGRIRRPPVSTP